MRRLFVLLTALASTPAAAVTPDACESDATLGGIIKQVQRDRGQSRVFHSAFCCFLRVPGYCR